jgi:hypothetical protein
MEIGKRKITPEKAAEILRKYGTIVSIEEATIILDFMYKLSKLTLEIILKDENC